LVENSKSTDYVSGNETMPAHGPLTYRQRDLAAAMRAAQQTGFPVRKIYIDRDGVIVIEAGQPPACTDDNPQPEPTEWEKNRDKI
jgi:hypothetical protein